MHEQNRFKILQIDAGANGPDSLTRRLGRELVSRLQTENPGAVAALRDLSDGIPLLDRAWLQANLKALDERAETDRAALAVSDELIGELTAADAIVITAPLYNFSVPAVLKAWIDQVARAGVTFSYSEAGPVGLLADRPVYLIMASGGVPFGSEIEFATRYMRHVLGFIGLKDVRFIGAEATNRDAAAAEQAALTQMDAVLAAPAASAA